MGDTQVGSYVKRSDMYFQQPGCRDYRCALIEGVEAWMDAARA